MQKYEMQQIGISPMSQDIYVATNDGICEAFLNYYLEDFTEEPGLVPARFEGYLADLPRGGWMRGAYNRSVSIGSAEACWQIRHPG